jgi:hypothetical protein
VVVDVEVDVVFEVDVDGEPVAAAASAAPPSASATTAPTIMADLRNLSSMLCVLLRGFGRNRRRHA